MFSGKTEELIRRLKRAQFANQKIAIFKPTIDNRYSDVDVVSHDLHSITSTPVDTPVKMVHMCGLANRGVRVIIAGLDTDFLGKPFGPMPSLMAIAEDVQKVHAICVKCGALANHSHRLSASTNLVELGEKDVYEPLCRQCYNAARAAERK